MLQEFSDEETRALFTHCYGHVAARDSIKQYKVMKDALDTTSMISKLSSTLPN